MSKFLTMTLLNLPRTGRKTVDLILKSRKELPKDPFEIREFLADVKQLVPTVVIPTLEEIEQAVLKTNTIIEKAYQYDIEILEVNNPKFPNELRRMPDSPVILYVKGNVEILNSSAIAVIGTRKPTPHGEKIGERFGAIFSEKGKTIVSGLAVGCDTAGHRGCLNVGGYTIAVMAQGLDKIYPAENKGLANTILEKQGCLISEYPPGQKSHPSNFVDRDRLQSGLSDGVVVVETDVKGGTMHTVGFSMKQKKLLGCYQHTSEYYVFPQSQGNRKLIEEGSAMPLRTSDDIDRFLQLSEEMRVSNSSKFSDERKNTNQSDVQYNLFS